MVHFTSTTVPTNAITLPSRFLTAVRYSKFKPGNENWQSSASVRPKTDVYVTGVSWAKVIPTRTSGIRKFDPT